MSDLVKRTALALLPLLLVLGIAACGGDPEPPAPATTGDESEQATEGDHGAEGAAASAEEHEDEVVELSAEALAGTRISTAAVEARALAPQIETTGAVGFNEDRLAHVGPRVAGRLASVKATLGQKVGRGEVLAVVDSVELGQAQADYLQAKSREEIARENSEREEKLAADRISSQQEARTAKAHYQEAAAELRRAADSLRLLGLGEERIARLRVGDRTLTLSPMTAPFAGTVVTKDASLGEMVQPEDELFTIADLGRVWIWIDVFEKDLAGVHLGDTVEVEVDAFPSQPFKGVVSFLSGSLETSTRTNRARIEVENSDGRLRPGMFARVRVSDPHAVAGGAVDWQPVPAVPESALQRVGDGFAVFVVEGEGRYRRQPVQVGRQAGGWVEIVTGVVPGAQIVVEGVFVLASEMGKANMGEGHGH